MNQGEDHGCARLDNDQAMDVYASKGLQSSAFLARKYRVSVKTIQNIWNGSRWSSVTGHVKKGKQHGAQEETEPEADTAVR
jgi:hypothetical protein